jgi:multicomponent Na+:H+ antiporter subunit G
MTETLIAILLGIGVLGFAFTAAGLLFSRDVYNQIHYLAPGSIFGSLAFAVAALVHEGFTASGTKAILIALILLISNPVLSHATARAARIRRNQQIMPKSHEHIPTTEELK